MANTYTQIYIHLIFAVSGRINLIKNEWKDELYKFISGIIRNDKQKLIVINGVGDHVHLLFGLKPDIALSHYFAPDGARELCGFSGYRYFAATQL